MPASNRLRIVIGGLALAAFALSAQTPPNPPGTISNPSATSSSTATAPETQPGYVIPVRVTEIIVPVTVHDRDGNIVDSLQPREFHLTDNGKEQNITTDVTFHPISLCIALQRSASVDAIMPQVKRVGSLLESFIIGDQGEAALLAFDARIQVKQDFTNEPGKISDALKKIDAYGSTTSRLVDAMGEGVRMLNRRPKNRRRILLVISETRDYGSEGRMRDVLLEAQFANVIVYTLDMSRMIATIMNKPYPGPGPMAGLPPAAMAGALPPGVPATPTTMLQSGILPGTNADVVPLLIEIMRDVKSIFVDNPAEKMTKATGGQDFSFYKQKGLEDAIAKIGSEIHRQYIITYSPNNKDEGGWHEIRVGVTQKNLSVRARPGYWMATVN